MDVSQLFFQLSLLFSHTPHQQPAPQPEPVKQEKQVKIPYADPQQTTTPKTPERKKQNEKPN
jgi:hypothetical protein